MEQTRRVTARPRPNPLCFRSACPAAFRVPNTLPSAAPCMALGLRRQRFARNVPHVPVRDRQLENTPRRSYGGHFAGRRGGRRRTHPTSGPALRRGFDDRVIVGHGATPAPTGLYVLATRHRRSAAANDVRLCVLPQCGGPHAIPATPDPRFGSGVRARRVRRAREPIAAPRLLFRRSQNVNPGRATRGPWLELGAFRSATGAHRFRGAPRVRARMLDGGALPFVGRLRRVDLRPRRLGWSLASCQTLVPTGRPSDTF